MQGGGDVPRRPCAYDFVWFVRSFIRARCRAELDAGLRLRSLAAAAAATSVWDWIPGLICSTLGHASVWGTLARAFPCLLGQSSLTGHPRTPFSASLGTSLPVWDFPARRHGRKVPKWQACPKTEGKHRGCAAAPGRGPGRVLPGGSSCAPGRRPGGSASVIHCRDNAIFEDARSSCGAITSLSQPENDVIAAKDSVTGS